MPAPADSHPVRVLVADDDATFRHTLVTLLDAVEGVEIVGSARDGDDAVRLFSELAPDVVLMDVVMPRCDGIQATKRILARAPDALIVALTRAEDYRTLALCLAAGAKGCLKKGPDTITLAPLMLALAAAPTRSEARKGKTPDPRRQAAMHAHAHRIRPIAPAAGAAIAIAIALTQPAALAGS